ncbi:MAG TPA: hypothetical protein VGC31_08575 [Paenirhodobacter sp.]
MRWTPGAQDLHRLQLRPRDLLGHRQVGDFVLCLLQIPFGIAAGGLPAACDRALKARRYSSTKGAISSGYRFRQSISSFGGTEAAISEAIEPLNNDSFLEIGQYGIGQADE